MTIRKNALLLFSKPPVAGLVKTRLTPLKDGIFSPEIAAHLYHCMLFDVTEICCDALTELEKRERGALDEGSVRTLRIDAREKHKKQPAASGITDTYDIIISTTPEDSVQAMEELYRESGEWPRPLHIIADTGASFDEHYNHAFNQVWELGYDTILSMGADMPALPRSVVVAGFDRLHELAELERGGIVLSADQAMGVSIIGWTKETPMDHTGVFYNPDGWTVLPAYIHKARELDLPALLIPDVPDVDTMLDLMHNVTLLEAAEYCAAFQDLSVPWRTIEALHSLGFDEIRVPPNELRDSRETIDS